MNVNLFFIFHIRIFYSHYFFNSLNKVKNWSKTKKKLFDDFYNEKFQKIYYLYYRIKY